MKLHFLKAVAGALLPLSAGLVLHGTIASAAGEDSPEIARLLSEAKSEATELTADSEDLASFAWSRASWTSHASKITMIKEHVNNTGKLLAKLQEQESSGSTWQTAAIARIRPLLKELASSTEEVIRRLNDHPDRVHLPEYRDCVKAHYELATDLEALIRDFVNYGEAKEKLEKLQEKLKVTE